MAKDRQKLPFFGSPYVQNEAMNTKRKYFDQEWPYMDKNGQRWTKLANILMKWPEI